MYISLIKNFVLLLPVTSTGTYKWKEGSNRQTVSHSDLLRHPVSVTDYKCRDCMFYKGPVNMCEGWYQGHRGLVNFIQNNESLRFTMNWWEFNYISIKHSIVLFKTTKGVSWKWTFGSCDRFRRRWEDVETGTLYVL